MRIKKNQLHHKRLNYSTISYNHIPLDTRASNYSVALNRKRRRGESSSILTTLVISIILIIAMVLVTNRAIGIHIDNQDKMLCESAKVSGNAEYLQKCQCFYETNQISCIQKGGGSND